MAIDYDQAAELINRLNWMRFYPYDSEAGKGALMHALIECSRDYRHAEVILQDAQQNFDQCPTPRQLLELAVQHLPEPTAFRPRRRYRDEKPFHGEGIYEIWTDRDVALHEQLLQSVYRDGKAQGQPHRGAREYAKQMLTGWKEYTHQHPDAWEVPRWQPENQPALSHVEHHDVRCHVCMDTCWQYVEVLKGAIGTVRRCICRRMLEVQTDAA
jgi:hypothetical protein